jgi:hypothetical protein
MARFWQVTQEDHGVVLDMIRDRYPNRVDASASIENPEHVFAFSSYGNTDTDEIKLWLEETGVEYGVLRAGSFTFIEFTSALDAVAFKMRWF